MEKTISAAKLAKHVDEIIGDVRSTGRVYRVTGRGGRDVVLIDQQLYESWIATLALMQQPTWHTAWEEPALDVADERALEVVETEIATVERPAKPRRRTRSRRRTT